MIVPPYILTVFQNFFFHFTYTPHVTGTHIHLSAYILVPVSLFFKGWPQPNLCVLRILSVDLPVPSGCLSLSRLLTNRWRRWTWKGWATGWADGSKTKTDMIEGCFVTMDTPVVPILLWPTANKWWIIARSQSKQDAFGRSWESVARRLTEV